MTNTSMGELMMNDMRWNPAPSSRWVLALLVMSACQSRIDSEKAQSALLSSVDMNNLMSDDGLVGGQGITIDDVQNFLVTKGWRASSIFPPIATIRFPQSPPWLTPS
jgi:hypothetical protein